MKSKNFIFSILMGLVLTGLIVIVFISVADNNEISKQIDQNRIQIPKSYQAASISKGTILLLLAVGVIGVLGISRKKKDLGSPAQKKEASEGSTFTEQQHLNEDRQKIVV